MDKPEFRVERGPAATDEAFAIGMAKLLEREGRTIAAAELRRLHEENASLIAANEAFGKRQKWWNEKMFTLEQQRDALLEALKEVVPLLEEVLEITDDPEPGSIGHKARAAIAAVGGEKT